MSKNPHDYAIYVLAFVFAMLAILCVGLVALAMTHMIDEIIEVSSKWAD